MKHTEPLQGMKLMQGHLVMHISMFIASFFIDSSYYEKFEYDDYFNTATEEDDTYKRRLVRY